jgi:hypothetical protein
MFTEEETIVCSVEVLSTKSCNMHFPIVTVIVISIVTTAITIVCDTNKQEEKCVQDFS